MISRLHPRGFMDITDKREKQQGRNDDDESTCKCDAKLCVRHDAGQRVQGTPQVAQRVGILASATGHPLRRGESGQGSSTSSYPAVRMNETNPKPRSDDRSGRAGASDQSRFSWTPKRGCRMAGWAEGDIVTQSLSVLSPAQTGSGTGLVPRFRSRPTSAQFMLA